VHGGSVGGRGRIAGARGRKLTSGEGRQFDAQWPDGVLTFAVFPNKNRGKSLYEGTETHTRYPQDRAASEQGT